MPATLNKVAGIFTAYFDISSRMTAMGSLNAELIWR